nr:MAG TPA: Replication initiation factor [Inoviridae sp.]
MGLSSCPWQEIKGAHGYRDRKYFSSISVHYNGREDMGVWVEMSGQGCRAFESISQLGWPGLFSFISESGLKITRLDVAFDDHTGILHMRDIIEDTQDGNFVSRSDYWETVLSSKGSTVQIGSPQSKVLVRIYDKARERHCEEGTHWNRVELQLRDDRAIQFTRLRLPIGEAFSGVLLNYLRYVIPDGEDSNRWRWPMRPYWLDMLEVLTPISIYTAPGLEYNVDRCREYVVNQAGNAIDCLIKIYGLNEFRTMIDNRSTSTNPKYENLVQQYRFERLAARCGRVFG